MATVRTATRAEVMAWHKTYQTHKNNKSDIETAYFSQLQILQSLSGNAGIRFHFLSNPVAYDSITPTGPVIKTNLALTGYDDKDKNVYTTVNKIVKNLPTSKKAKSARKTILGGMDSEYRVETQSDGTATFSELPCPDQCVPPIVTMAGGEFLTGSERGYDISKGNMTGLKTANRATGVEFFTKDFPASDVSAILNAQNCVGVRCGIGLDDNKNGLLFIIGITADKGFIDSAIAVSL